jgi:hypothetical protein
MLECRNFMAGPLVFPEFLYDIGSAALAVTALLTGLAYLVAVGKRFFAKRAVAELYAKNVVQSQRPGAERQIAFDAAPKLPPESARIARGQFAKRLKEAREALASEKSSARTTKFVSSILIFVQVVIGGVIATSFIQKQNPTILSLLGIVVLIATLLRQAYHPEIGAQQSKLKAEKLRSLIRSAEDKLSAIDARSTKGEDRTDDLLRMTDEFTDKLNEIESAELVEPPQPSREKAPS